MAPSSLGDAFAYASATVAAAITGVDQTPNTINIIFIADDLEAENTYKVHVLGDMDHVYHELKSSWIAPSTIVLKIPDDTPWDHIQKQLHYVSFIYGKKLLWDNGHPQDVCMEDTYIDQAYSLSPSQFLRMFTSAWMPGVIKLLETKKPPTGHFLFSTGAHESSPKVIAFKAD
ncbi:hypothetical protein SELMODRAFT_414702 [Selaginella moellendorffii]|uniref:Uncharacterized protein n=1 Tax=Selaginella moellendorffii TaxID=88036 RepID=D8RTM7_SELML|nr:hypothetical protein SELMODRAFT_414702 [Selaginella moellendorffii]